VTYRLDSDVPWLYGAFVDLHTDKIMFPSTNIKWKEVEKDFFDEELSNLSTRKTKSIAWFSTNCQSTSKRNELKADLERYITVDVYGACGTLKYQKMKY
jgi:alpha-1,3-fucosyltransferase